jgi:hypothetical protein
VYEREKPETKGLEQRMHQVTSIGFALAKGLIRGLKDRYPYRIVVTNKRMVDECENSKNEW